jgi:hypothetical protein
MAMFNPDTSASFPPPPFSEPVEQRFSDLSVFAAFVVALVFGSIAISLVSSGHIPIGVLFLAVVVMATLIGVRVPYVTVASSDGTLTFNALTRTVTTNVSQVERISHKSGGRGGSMWIFYFDGTRAQLNNRGGRTLADYVVGHNPRVDCPPSLNRIGY